MSSRVTLKDVARRAGVHLATASRALREGTTVNLQTRKRVEAAAKSLGYRPDPMMSALAAYRSSLHSPSPQGILIWLDLWPEFGMARKTFVNAYNRASERASRLGWELQEMSALSSNPKRLREILVARGISGVVVPPLPPHRVEFDFDWRPFSAVAIGHTLHKPRLHRVVPDQLGNMMRILEKCSAAGFTRPGFFSDPESQERTNRRWAMAFTDFQNSLPAADRIPPAIFDLEHVHSFDAFPSPKLLEWIAQHRPDVIITNWATWVSQTLENPPAGTKFPGGKPAVVGLNTSFGYEGTGIDENFAEIGAIAVNAVIGMMHRREKGAPKFPLNITVEGTWHDGPRPFIKKPRSSRPTP